MCGCRLVATMNCSLMLALLLMAGTKLVHSSLNCSSLQTIPNMESLLHGYNYYEFVEQKQSGARQRIFKLTDDTHQVHPAIGFYLHDRCSMKAIEKIVTNSRDYKNAIVNSMLDGNSFRLGQEADITLGLEAGAKAELSTKVEPFATGSSDNSESAKNQDAFYRFEKGQSVIIIARCFTYEVTMDRLSKPQFHPNFVQAVKQLYHGLVRNTSQEQGLQEFKNFIQSYGTHYPLKIWAGRTANYLRHFSHDETRDMSRKEIVDCGKVQSKISIFGVGSAGSSNSSCRNNAGSSDRLQSDYVTREKYMTTGAPLTKDMETFSTSTMRPVIVKARLIPLLNLFTPTNMQTILGQGDNIQRFRQKLMPYFWNMSNILGYHTFNARSCNCSNDQMCVPSGDGNECKRMIRLFWLKSQTATDYQIKAFSTDGIRRVTAHASQCIEKYCTHLLMVQDPEESLIYEIKPRFNGATRDFLQPKGVEKWHRKTEIRSLTFQRHPEAEAYWVTTVHPATQHVLVSYVPQCPHAINSLGTYRPFAKHYYHGLRCRVTTELIPRIDYKIYVRPIIGDQPHLTECGTYNYGVFSFFLEKFMFDSS